MKKSFPVQCVIACGAAVALTGAVVARDVTLAWDASPQEDVSGYVVSMGTNDGGPYPQQWAVAGRLNTQLVVSNLGPGRYFFVAQAVNIATLMSDLSNQAEASIPAAPRLVVVEPPALRLTGVVYRATNVLGPWVEYCRLPAVDVPMPDDLGIFRLGLEWGPVGIEDNP